MSWKKKADKRKKKWRPAQLKKIRARTPGSPTFVGSSESIPSDDYDMRMGPNGLEIVSKKHAPRDEPGNDGMEPEARHARDAQKFAPENAAMVYEIRRIVEQEAGLTSTPFLDDAVRQLTDQTKKQGRAIARMARGCGKYNRCLRCIGPLSEDEVSAGYFACRRCFAQDYEYFVTTHSKRLTQLPEPKPEVTHPHL